MIVQKTIKAKIVGLTNIKKEKLSKEYFNFNEYLKGNKEVKLYSATRQQADRLLYRLRKAKKFKSQPLIIRNDLVKVEKQDTKLSKFWCRVPVYKKSIWVAIQFPYNQEEMLKYSIRETKLIKKSENWFFYITVQKKCHIKKSYSSILAIDFGIRHIASVVQMPTGKTRYYGKELRKVRGHHYYLRKKLGKKKIRSYYKWIKNDKEKRIVNDLMHKISRDIVNWAKETNSLIAFGKLRHIKNQNKGRRFNRKLNSFPYFKLSQYIKYKAEWEGIKVVEVSEAYTSQICHRCGKKGIRKNGLFKCKCGLEDNSDRNGAMNIGKRVLGSMSNIGVSLTIPETEAVDIKIPIRNSVSDLRISQF